MERFGGCFRSQCTQRPALETWKLLPRALDAAERFRPLSAEEQTTVVGRQRPPLPEPGLGILAAD